MLKVPHHIIVMAGVLLAALIFRIADPQPIATLRFLVFDTYQRLSPRSVDPSYPVRIVDIDEASLAKIGQWPWPRTKLAAIIERLKRDGAKVVALDLILAEPDRLSPAAFAELFSDHAELADIAERVRTLPSNDERLASAMAKDRVVLGISGLGDENPGAGTTDHGKTGPAKSFAHFATAGDDPRAFTPRFSSATNTLDLLVASAAGLGAVNWLPAHDQVVRSVPTLVTIGGQLYPSLSLEAVRVANRQSTIIVKSSGGSGIESFGQRTGIERVKVGPVILNTTARGQLWLKFSLSDKHRYIPAHQILDGRYDASDIKGRYILIGASATGLMDRRATPLESSVPGVEVHAQALEQMLGGDYLRRPAYATGAELGFLAAIGILVAWLIRRYGPLAAAFIAVAAVIGVSALSWTAYAHAGILLDPVYPGIAVLLVYLAGSLFSYVRSEADKNRVRNAFGHYVAPQLVEELANNHDKLKLGGEMREVTLLFSDVRGFSKISERLDAEQLIRFVNALFTPLSDIILEQQGTIDKFMGDAVMAFWNAPVLDQNHAANACRAALLMNQEMERLNDEWRREAERAGTVFEPVRIGIGLNTGDCCVGNVGSPQRFDYSLLGDPVNIASRLESETKTFGVAIIAGERTAKLAQGFAFLPIGRIALRGKDNPETVFALVGDKEVSNDKAFEPLLGHQRKLLTTIESGKRAAAKKQLEVCASLDWPGLDRLYTHYRSKIAKMT